MNNPRLRFFIRVSAIDIVFALVVLIVCGASAQSVSTLTNAGFVGPHSVVIGQSGDYYITDSGGNRILKYDPDTDSLTTLAGSTLGLSGSTDGAGGVALFNQPKGIIVARGGLVVADSQNHTIRKVEYDGTVSTIVGSAGDFGFVDSPVPATARFRFPTGLAVNAGGEIFVADSNNNAIRKIDGADVVTTVVMGLFQPNAVAVDDTSDLWVADTRNHQIKEFASDGMLKATFGTGFSGAVDSEVGATASFSNPRGISFLSATGGLIVSDTGNNTVRQLKPNALLSTYSVNTVSGLAGNSGNMDGELAVATFNAPIGVISDSIGGSVLVIDSASSTGVGGALRQIQTSPPQPQISAPMIGYTAKFTNMNGVVSTRFEGVINGIFNNEVHLAIIGETGVETKFTHGATPSDPFNDTISEPNETSATAPFYETGQFNFPPELLSPLLPDLTIKSISSSPGRKSSTVAIARFQFKVANPSVDGDNAVSFVIRNQTEGAQMFYTTNGVDPHAVFDDNVADPNVFGPIDSDTSLSLEIGVADLTFKSRGFKENFQSSGVYTTVFSPTNFSANKLTFGFEQGEASSQFVGAAGQNFYAPVTLSLLNGAPMNGLIFNISATNVAAAPNITGALTFQSMLEAIIPDTDPPAFTNLAPSFATFDAIPKVIAPGNETNLVFTNGTVTTGNDINLLGVGYLEDPTRANLYDPTLQNLVTFSRALNNRFNSAGDKVILGGFGFPIPLGAGVGSEYRIRVNRSSGVVGFEQEVIIVAPTTGTTGAGSLNAIKHVSVGNPGFVVGDAMPFGWFNAGDFGDTNLLANDLLQVFQVAAYPNGLPPSGSDLYKAMDSSDGSVIFTFDGLDNAAIDAVTTGDGAIGIDDVFITSRRALDSTLKWYRRFYDAGTLTTVEIANQYKGETDSGLANLPPLELGGQANQPEQELTNDRPQARFFAGDVVVPDGFDEVLVEVFADIRGSHAMRVFLMNLSVHALDGAPAIDQQITFEPVSALGAPNQQSSLYGKGNYSAAWMNPSFEGFSNGVNRIGWLRVSIPEGATPQSAYCVSFEKVSASPNGYGLMKTKTRCGIITLTNRDQSSLADGLPDLWRLRHFGSALNVLSHADADADGDGVPNWKEFRAGTHPNDRNSRLALASRIEAGGVKLRFPTSDAKRYVIECSDTLFGEWSIVSPIITGDGDMMEHTEQVGANGRFYRVRLIEE